MTTVGRDGARLWRLVAALSVVLLLTACGGTPAAGPVAGFTVHDDDGMHGAVLAQPYRVPRVTLTDTAGDAYALRRDTTQPLTLAFFGYTHCPDICQLVMADIASAMTRLDTADRRDVGMLFISSDPARDDPGTLRTYLDRYDPSFEGLTGDLSEIVRLGNALGVPIEKGTRMPSGGYEVAHGTQIVALLDDGSAPIVWTEGTPAAQLAEDITELLQNGIAGGAS